MVDVVPERMKRSSAQRMSLWKAAARADLGVTVLALAPVMAVLVALAGVSVGRFCAKVAIVAVDEPR